MKYNKSQFLSRLEIILLLSENKVNAKAISSVNRLKHPSSFLRLAVLHYPFAIRDDYATSQAVF